MITDQDGEMREQDGEMERDHDGEMSCMCHHTGPHFGCVRYCPVYIVDRVTRISLTGSYALALSQVGHFRWEIGP